jgi:hypothetical protein
LWMKVKREKGISVSLRWKLARLLLVIKAIITSLWLTPVYTVNDLNRGFLLYCMIMIIIHGRICFEQMWKKSNFKFQNRVIKTFQIISEPLRVFL